jgi:hypothetical protein
MATRLFLHIGAMKSGTSFIQNVLAGNKDLLRRQGVLFPGERWRDQINAVLDMIEHGGSDQPPLAADGPWHRLAAEVNAWPGDAIMSMEFLGPRSPDKIRLIQDSFPGVDLQVVFTVRDLARSIPAMWQESVQNNWTASWPEFLDEVRAETGKPGPGTWFWRHQRVAGMARRWSEGVGKDHFTLITVPPKGAPAGLLWERFAQVCGLDHASYDLEVLKNPSIGAASAMVLRDLNVALAELEIDKGAYHRFVKHALAKRGLVHRHREEPVLGLDENWVRARGELEVSRLRQMGLRVVGDLEELAPLPVPGVHTDQIGADARLAAAVDGLAHAIMQWSTSDRTRRREIRKLTKDQS